MKIKNILLLFIITSLFSSLLGLSFAYYKNRDTFEQKIEKANYCETDSDCSYTPSKRSSDCYIYINSKEVPKISKLIKSTKSDKKMNCNSCDILTCKNNKCEANCDSPEAKEILKKRPEKTSTTCSEDSECQYILHNIYESEKYTTKCEEGSCVIIPKENN